MTRILCFLNYMKSLLLYSILVYIIYDTEYDNKLSRTRTKKIIAKVKNLMQENIYI